MGKVKIHYFILFAVVLTVSFPYNKLAIFNWGEESFIVIFWLLILFIIILMKAHNFTQMNIVGVFIILIIASLPSNLWYSKIHDSQRQQSIVVGDKIVQAIEKFYLDKHAYPENLIELAPNYIEKIPVSIMDISDSHFIYERWKTNSGSYTYALRFKLSESDIDYYIWREGSNKWYPKE